MAKKMVSLCQKRYDGEQNDKSGEKNGIIFYIMNWKNEFNIETDKTAKKMGVFLIKSKIQ